MKNFHKGFTLGEILICLGIIGILAALSLPKLVTFREKTIIGTSLGRTVATLQNGFANLIQQTQDISDSNNPITTIDAIQIKDVFTEVPNSLNENDYLIKDDFLFSKTKDLIGATVASDYDISRIKDYNGNSIDILNGNIYAYRLSKLNSVIIYEGITEPEGNSGDNGILTRILIDANGIKEPNKLGRDVFLFGLSNDGHLVPAGSEEYADFDDSVTANGCSTDIGTGVACAARVMQDKWKIEY